MPLLRTYLPEIITVKITVETFSSIRNRIIDNLYCSKFHRESSAMNHALTFGNLSL